MTTPQLDKAQRLVIKIGSLLLADAKAGCVRRDWLATLASDIAVLRTQSVEVIVVSSGAIALGRSVMKLNQTSLRLEQKQAAAACGQIRLIEAWQDALAQHHLSVAQILITTEDTEDRRRYLNARLTLDALLEAGVIPIINENDSIATDEIRYGDNDRLAARVAAMAGADMLLLLSDIDGLYDADPRQHPDATHIPLIERITPQIMDMAGDAKDHFSSGGMKTKVMAAQIATSAGCHMAILRGDRDYPVSALRQGGVCSWFLAAESPLKARKHWIASGIQRRGMLRVDDGAADALRKGKSLLAAGVTAYDGSFELGDAVDIQDSTGIRIAAGLVNYSHREVAHIMGKRTDEIEAILGYKRRDALIHRDDMVLV